MTGLRALPGRPTLLFSLAQQQYEHQLEMARPVSTGLVEGPPIQEGYALRQFRSGDEIRYDDLAAIPTPGLSAWTSRVSYQCHMNCDEWRQMTTKAEKRR
jgi:hypothetical protein